MSITHRFGKRIPLPSTRQIRHELILMWAKDEIKKALAAEHLKDYAGVDQCCAFQIQAAAMI
jgi:hypothetical protein